MEDSSIFATPTAAGWTPGQEPERIHRSASGYADLYRVDREGRFRVLKCLKPKYQGNPLYERLLRKEFEIGYLLRHPHIAEYYNYLDVPGYGHAIEIEWVDGVPLDQAVLTRKEALAVADQLCDALSYMHSKGVVHRDIKPSNLLVAFTSKQLKIIDFGYSDTESHSILKQPAGTRSHAAPEVLKGAAGDIRSDIYSVGKVLETLPGIPRRVIRKCCQEEPARRFASADAVRRSLRSARWGWWLIAALILLMVGIGILSVRPEGPEEVPSMPATSAVTGKKIDSLVNRPVRDTVYIVTPAKKEAPKTPEKAVGAEDIDALFNEAAASFDRED